MNDDISHLTIPVSCGARLNYQLRQVIAKLLALPGIKQAFKCTNKIVTKLNNIEKAAEDTRVHYEKMQKSLGNNDIEKFRGRFEYKTEFSELLCADHYRQELEIGDWSKQLSESGDIYSAVIPLAADMIRAHNFDKVLNFGIYYDYVDSCLARQFPAVQFTGVGRSPIIKYYNEQFFKEPNLLFESDRILDVLDKQSWKKSLFMHVRTLSVLPPAFTEMFYQKVSQSGCEHILLAEQCGLSWQTSDSYVFSYDKKPSVAFRNTMYIHNYTGLLKAAGYCVNYSTLLKTKHPDPNFRILIIAASKISNE